MTRQASANPSWRVWLQGARVRTLPLAVAPVVLGTASAWWANSFSAPFALLALLVAVAIQVGVNYANDYSDGVRGTDQFRVGPARLTGSGAASPKSVLTAALASFAVAGLSGLTLVLLTGSWWLLAIGGAALVAAWTYTGGKNPYGYRGVGELVVFVFFGLVATIGTAYVQVGDIPAETWLTGSAAGFFASAVLLVNNLRDIDQDRQAGKNTLAVKAGPTVSKALITSFLIAPYLILGVLSLVFLYAPAVFVTAAITVPTIVIVWTASTPKELITALQLMSVNALAFAVGLGLAIAL